MISKRANIITGVVLAAIVLVLPMVLPHGATSAFVSLLLAAIVTTGLAILMGYAGQVSLGQGAFFAIGAIATGMLAAAEVPPVIALVLGTLIAGVFALIVGYPLLRLRGNYLAFGTLALHLIVLTVVGNVAFFGGPGGISGIPDFGVGEWTISSPTGYAYLAIVVLGVVLFASYRIVHSRFGRGLRALSGSETAAESSGVAVFGYKIQVFTYSATVAAAAGGIYAFFIGYVSASSFSIMMSFEYVVMVVVGGATSLWGGVAGASLIVILTQLLNAVGTQPGMPATAPAVLSYAVYAIILIVTLLIIPRGVWPTMADFIRSKLGRNKVVDSSSSPPDKGQGQTNEAPDESSPESRPSSLVNNKIGT